jgi:hypothetical protein
MWQAVFAPLVLVILVLLPSHAVSENQNWQSAIETVEDSAKRYRDYAVAVGGTGAAGTMYNGYMYDQHRCAILGRILGLKEFVRHIEEFEYPPLSSESDPHDLLVFSISLDNWVAAAQWAINASESERKNVWNLDCVGQMGILASLWQESDTPNADFKQEGTILHVYGDIDVGFYNRFVEALDMASGVTEVTLGSGGGSVRDALLAGYEIRIRGLNTTLYGNCFSACPLLFVGGVERVLWANPHRLGFHQIYYGDGTPLPFDDEIYRLVMLYLEQMNVESSTVISWMLSAGPREMFEPEVADLCLPRVATFVQRICSSTDPY